MYNLNHIIVIVFNCTRAYTRVTLVKKKKKKKKKKVVRIANLQTIKTKSSPQFSSPMYYLFIVLGIYVHGLFHFGIMSMGLFSFFLTWKMEKISTKRFGITKKYIIFAIIFHVTIVIGR